MGDASITTTVYEWTGRVVRDSERHNRLIPETTAQAAAAGVIAVGERRSDALRPWISICTDAQCRGNT